MCTVLHDTWTKRTVSGEELEDPAETTASKKAVADAPKFERRQIVNYLHRSKLPNGQETRKKYQAKIHHVKGNDQYVIKFKRTKWEVGPHTKTSKQHNTYQLQRLSQRLEVQK